MSAGLLPCPFCGGVTLSITNNGPDDCFVECEFCGARGPINNESKCQIRWNRRAEPAAQASAAPTIKESLIVPGSYDAPSVSTSVDVRDAATGLTYADELQIAQKYAISTAALLLILQSVDEIRAIQCQQEAERKLNYENLYMELLFAVGMKYKGESRHETALRYIRRAENNGSGAAEATEATEEKT